MVVVNAKNAYIFAKITDIYKEHDKSKFKLKYITEELCVCVTKIYDLRGQFQVDLRRSHLL
jgi:hypothetical protein